MKFRQINEQNFLCHEDHHRSLTVGPSVASGLNRIAVIANDRDDCTGIRLSPEKARRLAARLIELADAAELDI